jgi:protein TonB
MIRGVFSGVLALVGAALSIGAAPQDYRKFVGQQKQFCGKVVEVTEAFKRKCDLALMIGSPSSKWKFAAVVPHSARTALPLRPEAYLLLDVCVNGEVVEEKKKPYIKVERPEQIQIKKGDPFWPGFARPCDEGIELPQVVSEVTPEYTREAMREIAQGTVEVEAVVDADGVVTDERIVRQLHPGLDAQSLYAVRRWRFRPATLKGVPVPMVVIIELTFKLK